MMKKLLLTMSLSLAALPVLADEMSPASAKGAIDLPPARTTTPPPPAAPVEAAPVVVAPPPKVEEAAPPRAAAPEPVVEPAKVAPAMPAKAAPVASAGFPGWYAGVGGGWSSFNGNGADIATTPPTGVARLDDDGAGWKVFGGYQFNKNLAAELAYTDLGKFSFDGTSGEYGEVKPQCWSLSAVGILPVGNNFSLLGKAGVCRWDDNYKGNGPIMIGSTGTDLTFGLGAKYDATRNLGVRAEWERFNNVVHDRESVDLFSMSLQYNF